jgi:hypothetical protein
MKISNYRMILNQASRMGVLQVALGGGNPNGHPQFPSILQMTREEYGIVPTYSTSGRNLDDVTIAASSRYCGAIAVSAYPPYQELRSAIEKLRGSGVRTNVHFVLDKDSINTAIKWLESPPEFLHGINAVIFLNYKPAGRGAQGDRLLALSSELPRFFDLVSRREVPFQIGFDSCMVSGFWLSLPILPRDTLMLARQRDFRCSSQRTV